MATAARVLEADATAALIQWARQHLGLTYREVATMTGTTTRTAQRWGDARERALPRAPQREKLDELRDLRRLLELSFSHPEDGLRWLHQAVPLLDSRRPIDLVRRGKVHRVTGVLAGAESGTFV